MLLAAAPITPSVPLLAVGLPDACSDRYPDHFFFIATGRLQPTTYVVLLHPLASEDQWRDLALAAKRMILYAARNDWAFDYEQHLATLLTGIAAVERSKCLWPEQAPEFVRALLGDKTPIHTVRVSTEGDCSFTHPAVASIPSCQTMIRLAHRAGRSVHLEVACGAEADTLRKMACEHPERLHVGVDPNFWLDPLIPTEENLVVCRSQSGEALAGLQGERVINSIQILAPYGFGAGSIGESDIRDYAQVLVLGGTLTVHSELYLWIQDFYAAMLRYFGNAQMKIYADPAHVKEGEAGPLFCFKWAPFCRAEWPFSPSAATEHWGNVQAHFPRLGQLMGVAELVAPVYRRALAPHSRYNDFNSQAVVFEVTATAR